MPFIPHPVQGDLRCLQDSQPRSHMQQGPLGMCVRGKHPDIEPVPYIPAKLVAIPDPGERIAGRYDEAQMPIRQKIS